MTINTEKLSNNEIIERLAEIMHEDIFQDNTDYEKLRTYLNKYGIAVSYADFDYDDTDGFLEFEKESSKPAIIVKAFQCGSQQRITMVLILGDLLLHLKWNPYEDFPVDKVIDIVKYQEMYVEPVNNNEKEKNFIKFVLAFLMPRVKVDKLLSHVNLRSEAEKILSTTFCVTAQVAKLRLNDLHFKGVLS